MKKFIMLLLCANFTIQCMESQENWEVFLQTQLNKKVNQDYSPKAFKKRIDTEQYPKDNSVYLQYFQNMNQLAKNNRLNLSDFKVHEKESGLNMLEVQCFAGYPDIAEYLQKQGCVVESTEKLLEVTKDFNSKMNGYYLSDTWKNLFVNQLKTIKKVIPEIGIPETVLICYSIIQILNDDIAPEFIEQNIQEQDLSPENLSNAYFYESDKQKNLNMTGFALTKGLPQLMSFLLKRGVDPKKLDQSNNSPIAILQDYVMSEEQSAALSVLEGFKNKNLQKEQSIIEDFKEQNLDT